GVRPLREAGASGGVDHGLPEDGPRPPAPPHVRQRASAWGPACTAGPRPPAPPRGLPRPSLRPPRLGRSARPGQDPCPSRGARLPRGEELVPSRRSGQEDRARLRRLLRPAPHSHRNYAIKMAVATHSRDVGIAVTGHSDRSMVDVYYDPQDAQGSGGHHLTTDLVSKSGIARHKHTGDLLATRVASESALGFEGDWTSTSARLGTPGACRYSRMASWIVGRLAEHPVVAEREAALLADVRRLAKELDALDNGSGSGSGKGKGKRRGAGGGGDGEEA
ncbi:unnamed protein product, partial [Scytosiphon promiscuus]